MNQKPIVPVLLNKRVMAILSGASCDNRGYCREGADIGVLVKTDCKTRTLGARNLKTGVDKVWTMH